jgi:NDP-sugar pyrophosphorylase family protein
LAGGLGTRIQAQFPDIPKPVIPVQGKPFLEIQLELLMRQGFDDFTFCVGYRAEQIMSHFGNGKSWGAAITYSIETNPLGTAGALKFAAPFFRETALVLNGDTYLDIDYRSLMNYHCEQQKRDRTVGTLALIKVQDSARYGEVILGEDHKIIEFREKAPLAGGTALINAGAYVFEPRLLDYIPSERATSLERETFLDLLALKNLRGWTVQGHFVDIGTPEGYQALEVLLR